MKPTFLKVKDEDGLIRDTLTGSIMHVDNNSYAAYKRQRNIEQQRIDKEVRQENRINTLENKIDSIENTLNKILEIISNGKS
ncbi:hypothetical protein UFOVP410_179 [uncultured Caudovirales phage]|uniref:Uncharacterized protein n=1 Tax=uncultured Caudovirales phage TaxID=2100421 RepID=A0A6J5M880_9CAUD|nr:hypothetical protein UFOVP410_179 [uncultured Caudovirales phage]